MVWGTRVNKWIKKRRRKTIFAWIFKKPLIVFRMLSSSLSKIITVESYKGKDDSFLGGRSGLYYVTAITETSIHLFTRLICSCWGLLCVCHCPRPWGIQPRKKVPALMSHGGARDSDRPDGDHTQDFSARDEELKLWKGPVAGSTGQTWRTAWELGLERW